MAQRALGMTLLLPSPGASPGPTGIVLPSKHSWARVREKIKSTACFLVPQQLKTRFDILKAPNFPQSLTTPWKTQSSPEWQVWASEPYNSCF